MTALAVTEFLLARLAEQKRLAEDSRNHWTRERVFAECASKMDILREAVAIDDQNCGCIGGNGRAIVAHLAAVYADHPDYRPEWRP